MCQVLIIADITCVLIVSLLFIKLADSMQDELFDLIKKLTT